MSLRMSRFYSANKALHFEVLVCSLQQELSLTCCSARIWRNGNAPDGLQCLGYAQELLVHGEGLSAHPSHKAIRQLLEEHHSHLATQGLSFVVPVFSSCQGLVFGDVQDHCGSAGEPVHEPLAENRFDVIPPSSSEGATVNCRNRWCSRNLRSQELSMLA